MTGDAQTLAILTTAEMARADRLAIEGGPHDGYRLMRNAGAAVVAEALRRFPEAEAFDILCGPGNNGGDGYVVARLLRETGSEVRLWLLAAPAEGTDAARAAADCPVERHPLANFAPRPGSVVIDALFGAGLARALAGDAARAAEVCREAKVPVLAVDLPSGISGDSGKPLGSYFTAQVTVTFFRLKPGHLLEPGRSLCGEVVLADIGIPAAVLETIAPSCHVNGPALWRGLLPVPSRSAYKYERGHVAVFSGGPTSTGAARLSAAGAARAGAGAVTIWSPGKALAMNAAQLTSTMVRRVDNVDDLREAMSGHTPRAYVIGPGFGDIERLRAFTLALLREAGEAALVLDADTFTAFKDEPEALFSAIGDSRASVVLTPHAGEFARLFPDVAGDDSLSKLDMARRAAERAGAVLVCKGPDTVIAAPSGRAAINPNGSPWLATAGSGDVLAGIVAGLAAQRMPAWEAACAAVWLHAEAAGRFGPGLIAEDLPGLLPQVLRELL